MFSGKQVEHLKELIVDIYENIVITLFLLLGFSRVLACKTRQPNWVEFDPRVVQMHQEALKRCLRAHFVRFGNIWPILTKFDQSWPQLTKLDQCLTKTMTRPNSRLDCPPSDHWKEHIKTFDSILYGSKIDKKQGSYGKNRKNRSDT